MIEDDHPAFPSKSEFRRKQRLAYGLSAVITAVTFYAAYANAKPISAESDANISDEKEVSATTVPIEQMDMVRNSRENPGVYIWGSNKHKVAQPESERNSLMNPVAIEVSTFYWLCRFSCLLSSLKERL